jgi:hypothetical protein
MSDNYRKVRFIGNDKKGRPGACPVIVTAGETVFCQELFHQWKITKAGSKITIQERLVVTQMGDISKNLN